MPETKVTRRENNKEEKSVENNNVFVSGRIEDEFEYSHETNWEKFYRTRVIVKRLSGVEDYIPIIVSDLLLGRKWKKTSFKNKWVEVAGQFRSHNQLRSDGKTHLDLFLFVTEINIYEEESEMEKAANMNLIYLEGTLCKKPLFKITSSGRSIADIMLAVNRAYRRTDYIPCIVWGRNAQWISECEAGFEVKLYGRIQSRKFFKKYSQDSEEGEYRTAYEISIRQIQEVEDLTE